MSHYGDFSFNSKFSDAKALVTIDGARRKGKTAPIKQQVDEHMRDLPSLKTVVVVRHTGIDCEMRAGRDVFYDEVCAAAAEPIAFIQPRQVTEPHGVAQPAAGQDVIAH